MEGRCGNAMRPSIADPPPSTGDGVGGGGEDAVMSEDNDRRIGLPNRSPWTSLVFAEDTRGRLWKFLG